jgi:hypothetical protein
MLSDEDKHRIEAEERAKLEAARALEAEEMRLKALEQYRSEVKTALNRPRKPSRLLLLAGFILLSSIAVVGSLVLLQPRASPGFDDFSGGIATTALVQRCQEDVQSRIGSATFPASDEITTQISSDADGKRWDGWVVPTGGNSDDRVEFSCQFSRVTGSLRSEIIQR